MNYFEIDLENFCSEIFYEMENISMVDKSHICGILAKDKKEAISIINVRLRNFYKTQLIKLPTEGKIE